MYCVVCSCNVCMRVIPLHLVHMSNVLYDFTCQVKSHHDCGSSMNTHLYLKKKAMGHFCDSLPVPISVKFHAQVVGLSMLYEL